MLENESSNMCTSYKGSFYLGFGNSWSASMLTETYFFISLNHHYILVIKSTI